jgi:hypothetical protein
MFSPFVYIYVLSDYSDFQFPPVHTAHYGHSATMTCTVDDLHFPFEFGSWVYSNDVKVQHMQESSSLGNSTTLVIDNCTYEQMGCIFALFVFVVCLMCLMLSVYCHC